ncbi:MAG: hypothetical protein CUN56_07595 [Phototrophicales bacterium]|nr:MAG: hypothetical protein CUN56_07595 [Phototrophicales bacterium]
MTQVIYDFGGTGDTLHLAVANGFPPQTYEPMLVPLLKRYHALSLVPRALWEDEPVPRQRLNWKQTLAADLINGLRQHDLQNIIGIGHSFGGVATLLAAIAEPQRFRAIILLDPTILPAVEMWWMRLARWTGRDLGNPLPQRAEKRKTQFESRQAAYDYFKQKRLFADWHPAAFEGYINALRQNGTGVTLAWAREWEAYYFRTLYTGTWRELRKLRQTGLPVLTIRGGTSDTLLPSAAKHMCRLLPEMSYHEIAGHGHLFPQSAPHQTSEVITSWLEKTLSVSPS